MKIEICGYSGAGKSMLAKELGNLYNIPVLHLDSINFEPNWVERDRTLLEEDIRKFMNDNESWVIDGSYFDRVKERYSEADYIIVMNFSRLKSLRRILKRNKTYKGIKRDDLAEGCDERFSLSFILWAMFGSRKKERRNKLKSICETYSDKVIYLKSQKDIDVFLGRIKNGGSIKEN